MAKSIVMNQMVIGGAGGGSISLMHGAALPETITPRAIFTVTEESVSGMIMQMSAPDHDAGLVWIEIASVGGMEVIGSDGEEAVELLGAWISTGSDWAPVEAYHSATGVWVQFSHAVLPLPVYTYTGDSELIDDGGGNWRIKFLTSGVLTLSDSRDIDVFLVGGGGKGDRGGGGGGYTKTERRIAAESGVSYSIVVAGAAGASSAFGNSANGGAAGAAHGVFKGGNGGSGGGGAYHTGTTQIGTGGSDGGNGSTGGSSGGVGQGTTTREFGEESGALYSGGGGAGSSAAGQLASGGDGGGGRGGFNSTATAGAANTGGGGGGGGYTGGTQYPSANGGSGIVIIRNAREVA